MAFFKIEKEDKGSQARCGRLITGHGVVDTPVFMPVGTKATVKAVTPDDLYKIGTEIILCNLYHIYLQPGIELIEDAGKLHSFMNWDRSILTDSGGFQVFSLGDFRKIRDNGVEFRSIIDGSSHFFTPEAVIGMQSAIGSDIAMVLDECIPYNEDYQYTKEAAVRTNDWSDLSIKEVKRIHDPDMKVFGIVQGGFIKELRQFCAEEISNKSFDGIAFGGLSVGEERGLTMEMLEHAIGYSDKKRPLYFMGLGDPEGILEAIGLGIDMFDCVMPTRISRNGSAFTSKGRINLKNKKYDRDYDQIEKDCRCYTCNNYSKSYVKHLIKSREILASVLLTIHNLHFIMNLVRRAGDTIKAGKFVNFKNSFLQNYKR